MARVIDAAAASARPTPAYATTLCQVGSASPFRPRHQQIFFGKRSPGCRDPVRGGELGRCGAGRAEAILDGNRETAVALLLRVGELSRRIGGDPGRARERIFEYIEVFHNRRRRHSSLGMLTTIEYEWNKTTPQPRQPRVAARNATLHRTKGTACQQKRGNSDFGKGFEPGHAAPSSPSCADAGNPVKATERTPPATLPDEVPASIATRRLSGRPAPEVPRRRAGRLGSSRPLMIVTGVRDLR